MTVHSASTAVRLCHVSNDTVIFTFHFNSTEMPGTNPTCPRTFGPGYLDNKEHDLSEGAMNPWSCCHLLSVSHRGFTAGLTSSSSSLSSLYSSNPYYSLNTQHVPSTSRGSLSNQNRTCLLCVDGHQQLLFSTFSTLLNKKGRSVWSTVFSASGGMMTTWLDECLDAYCNLSLTSWNHMF